MREEQSTAESTLLERVKEWSGRAWLGRVECSRCQRVNPEGSPEVSVDVVAHLGDSARERDRERDEERECVREARTSWAQRCTSQGATSCSSSRGSMERTACENARTPKEAMPMRERGRDGKRLSEWKCHSSCASGRLGYGVRTVIITSWSINPDVRRSRTTEPQSH